MRKLIVLLTFLFVTPSAFSQAQYDVIIHPNNQASIDAARADAVARGTTGFGQQYAWHEDIGAVYQGNGYYLNGIWIGNYCRRGYGNTAQNPQDYHCYAAAGSCPDGTENADGTCGGGNDSTCDQPDGQWLGWYRGGVDCIGGCWAEQQAHTISTFEGYENGEWLWSYMSTGEECPDSSVIEPFDETIDLDSPPPPVTPLGTDDVSSEDVFGFMSEACAADGGDLGTVNDVLICALPSEDINGFDTCSDNACGGLQNSGTQQTTNPIAAQIDTDGDGIADSHDIDHDGDGVYNADDVDWCYDGNCDDGTDEDGIDLPSDLPIGTVTGQSFYESEYPEGFAGVWETRFEQIKSTPLFDFTSQFETSYGAGSEPTWQVCFNLGFVDFGCGELGVSSNIWAAVRIFILFTAALFCRRLIFGG